MKAAWLGVVLLAAGCATPDYVTRAQTGVRRAEARLEAANDPTEATKAAALLEARRDDLRAAWSRCLARRAFSALCGLSPTED